VERAATTMGFVPHIDLPQLPGIVGLLVQYPQTGGPLSSLAEALLRGPSSLSPADRETIAAYVSARNECAFCAGTHGAVARHLDAARDHLAGARQDRQPTGGSLTDGGYATSGQADGGRASDGRTEGTADQPGGSDTGDGWPGAGRTDGLQRVDDVIANGERADVGPRLQSLLAIAEKVRIDGRSVSAADVARAREAGADDKAIHDTVLIAAAFCMLNRYVDGLATVALDRPEDYMQHAKPLADGGYLQGPPPRS
jgi:AhpD family alkylhydroperoxidase